MNVELIPPWSVIPPVTGAFGMQGDAPPPLFSSSLRTATYPAGPGVKLFSLTGSPSSSRVVRCIFTTTSGIPVGPLSDLLFALRFSNPRIHTFLCLPLSSLSLQENYLGVEESRSFDLQQRTVQGEAFSKVLIAPPSLRYRTPACFNQSSVSQREQRERPHLTALTLSNKWQNGQKGGGNDNFYHRPI